MRLKQVLINLTKNALKFSVNKPVLIKACYDWTHEMLKVHIVDKGIGIRKNDAKKLFQLFGKLDASAVENQEGIGMGLTICKKIVDYYDGNISYYSAGENQGSTFMFSLKMVVEESNKSHYHQAPKVVQLTSHDDNRSLIQALERSSCEVSQV